MIVALALYLLRRLLKAQSLIRNPFSTLDASHACWLCYAFFYNQVETRRQTAGAHDAHPGGWDFWTQSPFPGVASIEVYKRPKQQRGRNRNLKSTVIRLPGSPCGDAKEDERGEVCQGPESRSRPQGPRVSCGKPQQDHGECDVAEQAMRCEAEHLMGMDKPWHAADLERDEAAKNIGSVSALVHRPAPALSHYSARVGAIIEV